MANPKTDYTIPEGYEVIFLESVLDAGGNLLMAEDFGFEYLLAVVPSSTVPYEGPLGSISVWSL